jgi:hypothetical protein
MSEHLHLLDDDPRYAWTARKRGEWTPPVGKARPDVNAGVKMHRRAGVKMHQG